MMMMMMMIDWYWVPCLCVKLEGVHSTTLLSSTTENNTKRQLEPRFTCYFSFLFHCLHLHVIYEVLILGCPSFLAPLRATAFHNQHFSQKPSKLALIVVVIGYYNRKLWHRFGTG